MLSVPWLSISRTDGPALRIRNSIHAVLEPLRSPIPPSLILLIGKKEKSAVLREILDGPDSNYPHGYHGQVHLIRDPKSDRTKIIADCELHNHHLPHWKIP